MLFFSLRSISGTSGEESLASKSYGQRFLENLFYRKTGSFQKGWGGTYQTVIENIARYSKPPFVGKARVWFTLDSIRFAK
jgi:hypothetical protein